MGLAAGLLISAVTTAKAQTATKEQLRRRQEAHARHETNATRQARVQRTIDETYSHRWEVDGGGGYLRWRSGENTRSNNEVTWATSTSYFLNPKLSIIADARGSFGNAHALTGTANNFGVYSPQINEYFFTGGAGYRFYRRERLAISAQGTGGTAWGIFSGGSKGLNASQTGLWADGFAPSFILGVNLDYNIYPNLAVRFAPTYVATVFHQTTQNGTSTLLQDNIGPRTLQSNAGFNFGVVYRFGRQ